MMAGRQNNRRNFPNRWGFSLVETMITILIFGAIVSFAVPSMVDYITANRLETTTDRMVSDLQYARARAISDGAIIRFTSTTTSYTITNPNTAEVLRTQNFSHDLALSNVQVIDFYPWGMADATIYNLSNAAGNNQINLLPTGIVEVQ